MDCIFSSLPSFNFLIPIMSLIWGKQGRLWQVSWSQIATTHRHWGDTDNRKATGHTPEQPGVLWKDGELFWEDVAAILYLAGQRVYRGDDKGTVGRANSIKRYGVSDKVARWTEWHQSLTLMEEKHLDLFSFMKELNNKKQLMKEPYLDDAHEAASDGESGKGDTRGVSPMMVLLLEVSPGHSTEGGSGEALGIIKLRRRVWESSKANVVNLAHITKYKKKYLKKKSNICCKPKFSGCQEENDRGRLWKMYSYRHVSWWKTAFCSSVQELDGDSHPHQKNEMGTAVPTRRIRWGQPSPPALSIVWRWL